MKQKTTSSIPSGTNGSSNAIHPNKFYMEGPDLHHHLIEEEFDPCIHNEMNTHECVECQQIKSRGQDTFHLCDSYSSYNDCDDMVCDCCCVYAELLTHTNSPTIHISVHLSYSKTKNINTKINNLTQDIKKVSENIQHLNDTIINQWNSLQRLSQECSKLRKNYQEQNTSISKLKYKQEMSERNLLALQQKMEDLHYVSYNGSLIWRITGFAQKLDDAQSERQTSIYSPLFYSSPTGYNMRARLDIYGDGDARGTHMSIFLVLVRGDYDAILTWPFNFPVTFCLYDQTGQSHHIIDSFDPDTTSISFQKPRSEMNIASGIPKFCPLAIIERPGNCYVRDDTMFINITVNFDGVPKMLLPYTMDIDPGLPIYIQEVMRHQIIEQQNQVRVALVAQINRDDQEVPDLSLIPEYQQGPVRVRQPPLASATNSECVPCEDFLDDQ